MQNCAILLVALVAIGNVSGFYFPDRPAREVPENGSRLPEPKEIKFDDPVPSPIPEIALEGNGDHHPEPRLHDDDEKPEPREDAPLQLVPVNKGAETKQSSCQMNYAFTNPGESAVFHSGNYPREYDNNVQSTVCFTSPEGTTMSVTCDDFNVEYERSCSYDYLGLGFSGSPSDVQKYCGQGTLSSRPTSANNLAVVFKSDHSNPGGNRNPYRFRCKVQVSESSGGDDGGDNGGNPPSDGNCNCGTRNERIVGGQTAKLNEFPWRCYMRTNRYSFFCGCAVISNNWIITAAHCTQAVMPLQDGDKLYVVVGDHDRSTSSETQSQQIEISDVYDHPDYDDNTMDNDISLMKVRNQVVYSRTVSPVCLPWKFASEEFANENIVASGWGTTREGGQVSNTLQEVTLPVLTTEQCRRYMPNQITDNMICTYQPGKDTCQGDSGGSIDMLRSGRYYEIGIVSWGYGCARENNPGVYAKVTKYLPWIRQTAQGETFCDP